MTEIDGRTPANPGTAGGLMEFLDAAIDKGWFNVSSAKALKTATQKILSIDGGWEDLDLRSLDHDGIYERFRNLKHNEYSDDTMRIYKSRLGQATKMYLGRLDNDPAWKSYGPSARASSGGGNGAPKKFSKSKASSSSTEDEDSLPLAPVIPATRGASLMSFPYPLRENLDVHLNLPRDLTKSEAERLCRFINSLAREEMLQLTAGSSTE